MTTIEQMLGNQQELQKLLGKNAMAMSDDQRASYMTEMAFALVSELHEAMGEVGWKSWATSRHVNFDEFYDEMTDVWLFFMNLMLATGMTAEDLIKRTAEKQINTERRWRDRYDGRTEKCPKCKRAYDNKAVKCQPPNICAYTMDDLSYDPDTHCSRCKELRIATKCTPATGQGFGWCNTLKMSFDITGHVVGEQASA